MKLSVCTKGIKVRESATYQNVCQMFRQLVYLRRQAALSFVLRSTHVSESAEGLCSDVHPADFFLCNVTCQISSSKFLTPTHRKDFFILYGWKADEFCPNAHPADDFFNQSYMPTTFWEIFKHKQSIKTTFFPSFCGCRWSVSKNAAADGYLTIPYNYLKHITKCQP